MRLLALVALLAVPSAALAQGVDDDFEVEEPQRSLALGPSPRGGLGAGLGVGWLRSDLVANLGLGWGLDVVVRADSMLLYRGLNAQNSIAAGLRYSPFDGFGRLSAAVLAGETYIPLSGGTKTFTSFRGELAAGVAFERLTVFGRLAAVGASADSTIERTWAGETEAGLGVETTFSRKFLLGAEVFAWGRERSETLLQWRLRVGWFM